MRLSPLLGVEKVYIRVEGVAIENVLASKAYVRSAGLSAKLCTLGWWLETCDNRAEFYLSSPIDNTTTVYDGYSWRLTAIFWRRVAAKKIYERRNQQPNHFARVLFKQVITEWKEKTSDLMTELNLKQCHLKMLTKVQQYCVQNLLSISWSVRD